MACKERAYILWNWHFIDISYIIYLLLFCYYYFRKETFQLFGIYLIKMYSNN